MQRVKFNVYLEFNGKQYFIKDIEKRVKQIITDKHKNEFTTLEIYIQPETNFIYYTLDGIGNDTYCINFDELTK